MSKNSKKSPKREARIAHQKEIEAKVDQYIEKLKTEGKALQNSPEELNAFFVGGALAGLNRIDSLAAKQYFKSLLPYQEWRDAIAKDPDKLSENLLHFRELQEGTDQ